MTIDDAPQRRLRLADQQWAWGQLDAARAGYQQVLGQVATSAMEAWHARFQLAWIDAAFTAPPAERLDELRRPDLPQAAQRRLELLARRGAAAAQHLSGDPASWDIAALAARLGSDVRAWQEHAAQAAAAGQYGLAQACHAHAAEADRAAYAHPPSEAGRVAAQTEQHLAALRW